jgi:hypothetical protein
MFTSYEDKAVLLYRNYSKMFITLIFCFAENNKLMPVMQNTMPELDWKKKDFHGTFGRQG